MIDQGPNARNCAYKYQGLPWWVRPHKSASSTPMRSRFALQTRLDYYGREDLTKIVLRSCKLWTVKSIKKGGEVPPVLVAPKNCK